MTKTQIVIALIVVGILGYLGYHFFLNPQPLPPGLIK